MTVGELINLLGGYPRDWPVLAALRAGGGIEVAHREIGGQPVAAIFGSNGGCFGENPLTEEEYWRRSERFLFDLECGRRYTSIHGDHRTYDSCGGSQATCYGTHYDRRIIERMVKEGRIQADSVDLETVANSEAAEERARLR